VLQWGRVLWDAERRLAQDDSTPHRLASMGPRLVGRGKSTPKSRTVTVIVLQWGRVLWDAERIYGYKDTEEPDKLQWGRVLWDAERRTSR